MQEARVRSLARELRSCMPWGQKKKQQPQNRNNGVKDPTKTFKMVCIKKKNLKKKILDKVCGLNPEGTREP